MEYRREIDGLRAVAVLPVMLFHAGFDAFSGGFVGVDVFFVISGYLITTIIVTELEQRTFSIAGFYERRARRILPALFLVMLFCVVLAWGLLLPGDMKEFGQSLVAVSVFASNVFFWRESGYFDTAAELKPLLHTWSLSVEEQYYVLFPVALMLTWRLGKRSIALALGLIGVASLLGAQWAADRIPDAAFFLLPTRGWELLTGALAALYLSSKDRTVYGKGAREVAGWLGIALICYAVLTYSRTTPFPGLYALAPTVGTVLIILFASQQTTAGTLLGHKVLVGLGLISYSTYLFHQPLFAFARHAGASESSTNVYAILIALSVFLGYLSWRYVEAPFRRKATFSRRSVFAFSLAGSAAFLSFGIFVHQEDGYVSFSSEQETFLRHFENGTPRWQYMVREGILTKYRYDCNFYDVSEYLSGGETRVPVDSIPANCFTKSSAQARGVFIWGDSHAQQLFYGLRRALPQDVDVLQVASSGCPAFLGAVQSTTDYCQHSNWFAINAIKKVQPSVVIVGQRRRHNPLWMEQVSRELRALGVERVIFTGPTPNWLPSLPGVVVRMLPKVPQRTFRGVDRSVMMRDKELQAASKRSNGFEYVSVIDYFCNSEGCLLRYGPDAAATATSWDYGHLTPIASYHFAQDVLVPYIMSDGSPRSRSQ